MQYISKINSLKITAIQWDCKDETYAKIQKLLRGGTYWIDKQGHNLRLICKSKDKLIKIGDYLAITDNGYVDGLTREMLHRQYERDKAVE